MGLHKFFGEKTYPLKKDNDGFVEINVPDSGIIYTSSEDIAEDENGKNIYRNIYFISGNKNEKILLYGDKKKYIEDKNDHERVFHYFWIDTTGKNMVPEMEFRNALTDCGNRN